MNQKTKENELHKSLDKRRKRDSLMIGLDDQQGEFNENNLITGDKKSNLTYALSQAAKNYKRKGLTLTEYDDSKDDLILLLFFFLYLILLIRKIGQFLDLYKIPLFLM